MSEQTNSFHQKKFLQKQKMEKRMILFTRLLVFFLFLGVWEATANCGMIDSFIFSSPSRIATEFFAMAREQSLFSHIGITLTETLISFFFVVLLGLALAVLLWACPRLSQVFEPYLVVLNSLPKSALAPLLIVWLGANTRTIIVAGMSVAIFGTIISLYTGFRQVDQEELKLIDTLGGKKRQQLTKIVLPSCVPLLLATMKVNIGLCLVGVIIGEFIGARKGLGYLIIYSTQTFRLNTVLMSICVLMVIAMFLYGALNLAEKFCLRKK